MEKGPVSLRRASELLDVSDQSIRNWIRQGKIRPAKNTAVLCLELDELDKKLIHLISQHMYPNLANVIRVTHVRVSQYMAAGGIKNLEPQRLQLEEYWYKALKSEPLDFRALTALFTWLEDFILVPPMRGVYA